MILPNERRSLPSLLEKSLRRLRDRLEVDSHDTPSKGSSDRSDDQLHEVERCRRDPVHFINEYGWTYNPKLIGEKWLRFSLFPKQIEYIEWLHARYENREDGVCVKSREVGFSWLNVAFAIWLFLFHPDTKIAFGSRKEEYVDELGNPDSLLEKGRLFIRRLPPWMLPIKFDEARHLLFCRFTNPENGSVVTGETGKQMGRGGRNTIYFVDEWAFIEQSKTVLAALSANSDCRIFGSTPNGIGNSFYTMVHSGNMPVFRYLWHEDPRKNRWVLRNPDGSIFAEGSGLGAPEGAVYPWRVAAEKKLEHDPVLIAQEIDARFDASIEGVVIPANWVQAAVNFPLDALGSKAAGLDISSTGANETIIAFRIGPVVKELTKIASPNSCDIAYGAIDFCNERDAGRLALDAIAVGVGVSSVLERTEVGFNFEIVSVIGGAQPSDDKWPDGRTSRERFLNRRAELAWKLRERFRKTFERRESGEPYPDDECISIPNNPELIAQLSIPISKRTATGKIKVESKDDMKTRGVMSPDNFDVMMYLFDDSPSKSNHVFASGTDASMQAASSYRPR